MRILFLDTETGGLDETQYDLLSVGMVVWEDNKIIDTKEILISKAEYKTDPEAMKVNGLDLLSLQKNGISELMAIEEIEKFCHLETKEAALAEDIFVKRGLSLRTYHKMLKIARTIADMDGSLRILPHHIMEAADLKAGSESFFGAAIKY